MMRFSVRWNSMSVLIDRAPYPGIMGAIGAALLAKEEAQSRKQPHFIGLDQWSP